MALIFSSLDVLIFANRFALPKSTLSWCVCTKSRVKKSNDDDQIQTGRPRMPHKFHSLITCEHNIQLYTHFCRHFKCTAKEATTSRRSLESASVSWREATIRSGEVHSAATRG